MKSPILNLFLPVLRILFNLNPDAYHKGGRFSKVLPKKYLKFVLSKKNGIIIFNLDLVLLPIKVDLILKK